jgi:hypothetical protein
MPKMLKSSLEDSFLGRTQSNLAKPNNAPLQYLLNKYTNKEKTMLSIKHDQHQQQQESNNLISSYHHRSSNDYTNNCTRDLVNEFSKLTR